MPLMVTLPSGVTSCEAMEDREGQAREALACPEGNHILIEGHQLMELATTSVSTVLTRQPF